MSSRLGGSDLASSMIRGEGKPMDIGAELRNARKARKLSIEEIARVTKISPSVLRAIDRNDFSSVPGGLFTRGFLRAYAREVGLDPEEIVQLYRTEFEQPEIPVP